MISRNAQLVAIAVFGSGIKARVTFHTPDNMSRELKDGIEELLKHGMIEPLDKKHLPAGSVGWKGAEQIGLPCCDFALPSLDEALYLTKTNDNEEREKK